MKGEQKPDLEKRLSELISGVLSETMAARRKSTFEPPVEKEIERVARDTARKVFEEIRDEWMVEVSEKIKSEVRPIRFGLDGLMAALPSIIAQALSLDADAAPEEGVASRKKTGNPPRWEPPVEIPAGDLTSILSSEQLAQLLLVRLKKESRPPS